MWWTVFWVCYLFVGVISVIKFHRPDKDLKDCVRDASVAAMVFCLWPVVCVVLFFIERQKAAKP